MFRIFHCSGLAAVAASLLACGLAGCASRTPAPEPSGTVLASSVEYREICLADGERAPARFLVAVRQALEDKGFKVRAVPASTDCTSCEALVRGMAVYGAPLRQRLIKAELWLERRDRKVPLLVMWSTDNVRASLIDDAPDDSVRVRGLVDRLFPEPGW